MIRPTEIAIPTLVRVKDGALDRLGIYLGRSNHRKIALFISQGLVPVLTDRVKRCLHDHSIDANYCVEISDNGFEDTVRLFADLPQGVAAVVGVGGGKALDVAKYLAFLARLPYYAVPTSLSNDGFCSPQSSLTIRGRRKSVAAVVP